jgi:hypothetical protein
MVMSTGQSIGLIGEGQVLLIPVDGEFPVRYWDIPGWPDYQAGDDGSIWSRKRRGPGYYRNDEWKPLNPYASRKSKYTLYYRVNLSKIGYAPRKVHVHDLILETFVCPCPPGMECLHYDGNGLNNHLINLSWGTHLENSVDQIRHGRSSPGEKNGFAWLTEDMVEEIRESSETTAELARQMGVDWRTIDRVRRRESWKHIP